MPQDDGPYVLSLDHNVAGCLDNLLDYVLRGKAVPGSEWFGR